MKKETEGYFVIKHKIKDKYITDNYPCLGFILTQYISSAMPFETRTKAYKYMRENNLDKDYVIEEVK